MQIPPAKVRPPLVDLPPVRVLQKSIAKYKDIKPSNLFASPESRGWGSDFQMQEGGKIHVVALCLLRHFEV